MHTKIRLLENIFSSNTVLGYASKGIYLLILGFFVCMEHRVLLLDSPFRNRSQPMNRERERG